MIHTRRNVFLKQQICI